MSHSAFTHVSFAEINGTSLCGYIEATYAELIAVFGLPSEGDGAKTDAEWAIRLTRTGNVAAIYNWKNGPAYGGSPISTITRWNVGGRQPSTVVSEINELLLEYRANRSCCETITRAI